MKQAKAFTERHEQLARWAKALAHPARVAILEVLLRRGSCVCGDIVAELPLAQATVSQHLKVLKEAGLVRGDVEGRNVCYCPETTCCTQVGQVLQSFLRQTTTCC